MGVDIYGYPEVLENHRWAFVGRMILNPERECFPDVLDEPVMMPERLFHSSHKELSAILTDSGNPIRSSEPYTPVVPRRGLPSDLSSELAGWLRRHEGKHWFKPTWFTAREAIVFGWTERLMRRRADVVPEVASLFAGCPRGFPYAGWPASIPVSYAGGMRDGVQVEWLESYAEIVPQFVNDILPRLAGFGAPDEVRLVVVATW